MSDRFYVSTPIYYVNGAPHIGHAYTTLVADALARYHRLQGARVFFLTGTDEHGLKIQRSAEAAGESPQAHVDKNSAQFRQLFDRLKISYDRFIRTTEPEHKRVVTAIVERMIARDDVYLGRYEGWYSAADEAFYAEDEVEQGKAKASGSAVEWVVEHSYFFRLSAYQQPLLDWYRQNPGCVQPASRYNEVVSFVEGGLEDLSISRTTFDWGIPWPQDPKHVLYVWVDALTNYVSALGGFEGSSDYDTFWPCDVHLIGKDILRFHAVYWPAFLMSAQLPTPRCVFAHGWWLSGGEKMSKSKGNFIDAESLLRDYELDVLRYYMLREVPLGNDGNFAPERLIERHNAELADNYGNLVNRSCAMLQRFGGGVIPPKPERLLPEDEALITRAAQVVAQVDAHVRALELHRALEVTLQLSSELNLYLQQTQPWRLAKDEAQAPRLSQVLYHVMEGIRVVTLLLSAFVPDATARVLDALGASGQAWSSLATWGGLTSGQAVEAPAVLFQKIEIKKSDASPGPEAPKAPKAPKTPKTPHEPQGEPQPQPQAAAGQGADQAPAQLLDFGAFAALELRVGLVVAAERLQGSSKLLKLQIELGEARPRTVVSGIAKSFAPEDLVGNRYAVVTNLKPAKLFGVLSEAMVLAAERADGSLELARFSEAVSPGTRIS